MRNIHCQNRKQVSAIKWKHGKWQNTPKMETI